MVKPELSDSSWEQDRKLVLGSLDEIKESAKEMEVRLRGIELELALLKLKSSLWGGLAGLGAYLAVWAMQYIQRKP
jgi:hypothetical protein